MSKKEYNDDEKRINKSSVIQDFEYDEDDSIKLHFNEIDLLIDRNTFEAMHKIRTMMGCEIRRVISFLLDCGAVMYDTLEEQMKMKIQEIVEEEKKRTEDKE